MFKSKIFLKKYHFCINVVSNCLHGSKGCPCPQDVKQKTTAPIIYRYTSIPRVGITLLVDKSRRRSEVTV